MDRVNGRIASSRLNAFERHDSLLFLSVLQNIVANDYEDDCNILDIPKNHYLFLNNLANNNANTRRISLWNFQGWSTAQDAIEPFFLSVSNTDRPM